MAHLPEIERADAISRDRWSMVMGQVLLRQPYDVRCAMVAGGYQEFERHARRFLGQHDFRQEDFQRMFRIVTHGTMTIDESARV